MGEKNITTVSIPTPLAEKLKVRIEGTGFSSLSSYVTYILRQVVSGIEIDEQKAKDKEPFSEEDEKKVKDRLRGLGYLD
jgi:Arc/MetJ-type ribon-helix-helix transcriptional regulator